MITFHEGLLAVMMLYYTHAVLSKGLFGGYHFFIGALMYKELILLKMSLLVFFLLLLTYCLEF